MTQAINLNAGLAVSAKGDVSLLKRDQSQLVLEEFASIMNQSAQGFQSTGTGYEAHTDETPDRAVTADGTVKTVTKDYEKFESSGGRKIVQVQAADTDSEAVSEKVQELASEVKEVLQETMQISEEDIENAMEVLGLGNFELLQPQKLIGLVQELTGNADVSALLTNENFQVTLQQVTELITEFQQDNGLNAVQFSDLLEQLSTQIDELEETVKQMLNIAEEPQQETVTGIRSEVMPEVIADEQQMPVEHVQTVQKVAVETEQQDPNVQSSPEQPKSTQEYNVAEQPDVMVVSEETQEEVAPDTEQENQPQSQGEKSKQPSFTNGIEREERPVFEQHADLFHDNAVVPNEQPTVVRPEAPQVQSYIQVEQLMDQMEGLARIFASTEGTTVEMQLNPENLGRLILSVTEKHGNVTAQITASNEQVKETLQTQMVELRATLQAQGIKVEAVEVTVATHEFEQNLDGNASANGQMQDQSERQNAGTGNERRNLNMNNPEELSGLMSEEETLVAQMMRDNGGTVDFTA